MILIKIIAFEGLDKSGKHSISEYVVAQLRKKGYSVKKMEFPRYDTPTGKLIRAWLTDQYDVDAHTFELIQAADKQAAQREIRAFEEQDVDYLIMDRYVHSQLAYGSYDNNVTWVNELSKYIRYPDAVVYLKVDPEISMSRAGQHGENDRYERDKNRLASMDAAYRNVFNAYNPNQKLFIQLDANQDLESVKEDIDDTLLLNLDKL